MNMYNKGVCVRMYLRISHKTTILAVFWWMNVQPITISMYKCEDPDVQMGILMSVLEPRYNI